MGYEDDAPKEVPESKPESSPMSAGEKDAVGDKYEAANSSQGDQGLDGGRASGKPSLADLHDQQVADTELKHPEMSDQDIRDAESRDERMFSQAANPEMQRLSDEGKTERDERLRSAADGMSDESKDALGNWEAGGTTQGPSTEAKQEALQDYSNRLAEEYGVSDAPRVEMSSFGEGGEREAGVYDADSSTISVNTDCAENATASGALNTVAHEFEHARQAETGADAPSETIPVETPEAFEKYGEQVDADGNLVVSDYIPSSESEDAYFDQPLEKDAYDFGDRAGEQWQRAEDEDEEDN